MYVIIGALSVSELAKIKGEKREIIQERFDNGFYDNCRAFRYDKGKIVHGIDPSILNESEKKELLQMRKKRNSKRDVYLPENESER